MVPDGVRRGGVVLRQVLGALAGGGDAEAAGSRPVDQLGDESGLVTVGHRVDDAGRASPRGEGRTGEHVGLDIDHDQVLASSDGLQRVADASDGIASRLDDHLDVVANNGGLGIVREAHAGDLRRSQPSETSRSGTCSG